MTINNETLANVAKWLGWWIAAIALGVVGLSILQPQVYGWRVVLGLVVIIEARGLIPRRKGASPCVK
jgi:predicted cobalt transporter CbtA